MPLNQVINQINGEHILFEKRARDIAKQLTLSDLLPYFRAELVHQPEFQQGQLITIPVENGRYRIEVSNEKAILYMERSELTRFTGSKITPHYRRLAEDIQKKNQEEKY